jgi:hypothetical protein
MAPTYQASTELRRTIAERIDLLYWFLDVDDHLQALVLEADRDIAQIEQNGGAVPEELVAAWREECAGGEMSLGAQDAPTPAFFFEERVRVVKALRALHDAMRAAVDPASRADPWRYFDDVVGVDRRWITAAARRAHSVRFGGRRSVLPTVPPPDDAAVAPPVDGMGDAAVAPPVDGMGDAAVPPPVDGMDDAAVAPPVDGMGDAAVAPPVDGMGDAAVAPPVDGMGDAAVAPPVDGMDDAAVAPPVDGMDDAAVAPPVDGMDDAAVAPPVDGMGDAAVASPVDGMGDAAVASPVDGMGDAAVGLRSGPGDVMSGYLAALRYRTTVVRTALAPARVRDTKRALVVEALRELYEAARHVAKREWTESDEFRLAVAAYLEERYPQHGTKFLQRRG